MNHLRPTVLVFAGNDPSGGAGIAADIQAVAAQGAHALPVITALTVQDNDRVFGVQPVDAALLIRQADVLAAKMPIHAIKIGIVAQRANAEALAIWIAAWRQRHPAAHVVLDPVLASGHGDLLSVDDAVQAMAPLLAVATVITPNLPEIAALCPGLTDRRDQAGHLMQYGAQLLVKGGHADDALVTNTWHHHTPTGIESTSWQFNRLAGTFHGSGCTLASALAARLATGYPMQQALDAAQHYCHQALQQSFAIAAGQRIPQRTTT